MDIRVRTYAADVLPATPTGATVTDPRRAVGWRSLSLGLLGAVLIAGITPYNNYVLDNTDLVGGFVPTGGLMFLFALLLGNAVLHRWRPSQALGGGELAVVLAMLLAASALPAGGLMRYLPGNLVGLHVVASEHPDTRDLLRRLDLPDWLFPTFESDDPAERGGEPVVRDYIGRSADAGTTFGSRVRAVPWRAWITPALTWGVFLAAVGGGVVLLGVLLRRQWAENERLQFPVATVFASLIEPPAPGRALNALLRGRLFWIAAGSVIALHSMNGLHAYLPRYVPEIPLRFDLSGILTTSPWYHTETDFRAQRLCFTMIGLTYFIESRLALSMVVFFLLLQVARMYAGEFQAEITTGMQQDQVLGAMIPYALMLLWIARRHLRDVAAQMLRRPRENEPRGRYLSYAAIGWGLVACVAAQVAWLVAAGASTIGAIGIVAMVLLIALVLMRVVAESGLIYVFLPAPVHRPWAYLMADLPGPLQARTTEGSLFFGSLFSGVLTHDLRQNLSVYALHALRTADHAGIGSRSRRPAVGFVLAIALAAGVAYAVSFAATLYVEYAYAAVKTRAAYSPLNEWGVYHMPRWWVLQPLFAYLPPNDGPAEAHSRLGHLLFGASAMSALGWLRWRFAEWPLHPLGFLLMHTMGLRWMWFSIFLGWMMKSGVIRFGGANLFDRARPLFLGMILGEAMAAALWLTVAFVLSWMGLEHLSIQIMWT